MEEQARRERAFRALSRSRRHRLLLSETASSVGLESQDVLQFTAEAFERRGDDWVATPRDSLHREMQVLTEDGPEWVDTYDSRVASRLGQQDNAVRYYLNTGDPSRLRAVTLRIGDRIVRLASDPQTIDRLAEGGEIHLEVYRR